MFANSESHIKVKLTMFDGTELRGSLARGHYSGIEAILAKESPFLEFQDLDGQKLFVTKSQIMHIATIEPLTQRSSLHCPSHIDAYNLLGVQKNCTTEEMRSAYHKMAKQYHPDSYAGQHIPDEIKTYVSDRFKQINTAYLELKSLYGEAG